MNEQLPSPDFNSAQYERPNQNWICGKAKDGKACHLGPDAKGHCHATTECKPALKIKPGEAKGRYYCTRTAECGGPCAAGPLPDGACSRPVSRCVPERSLRAKRKVLTLSACIVTAGLLLAGLSGSMRWNLISPGALSAPHSTASFAKRAGENNQCAVCHSAARGGISGWIKAGLTDNTSPFRHKFLGASQDFGLTAIDQHCLVCHPGHTFHQPNVPRMESCSSCHVEHMGAGPMRPPPDDKCLSCHGSAEMMAAAVQLGQNLPASAFEYRSSIGGVLFHEPRPARGFTQVIHSFAGDHPEFQFITDHLKDPDTLKFNHKLHLDPAKVTRDGRPLACADCHKPDAAGTYHLKISYAETCQKCHAIQFDVRNPGLLVPHGNAANVRAFLRNLPQEYADYSARTHGNADGTRDGAFARQQIVLLQKDFISGEELERRVFFSDKGQGPGGPANFPGCAYCHEVRPSANGLAQITPPIIPDRWLVHGNFDHSKHLQNITCERCHDAAQSQSASDILLPSKQTCAACHSPAGGVASNCSTCHGYHSVHEDFKVTDSGETLRRAIAFRDK